MKLAKKATKDPSKLVELLDKTSDHITPEAKEKLTQTPAFSKSFLEGEAQRFGVDRQKVEDVAAVVVEEAGPAMVVEEREWSMEGDVKEYFRELYEREIAKRQVCTWQITEEWEKQRTHEDGSPMGKPQQASVYRRCNAKLESIQQALVHHSLHLMFDSSDPRTQRAMWNDIKETLFPTREKSVRAALSVEERRRMMGDPRLRERILRG